MEKTFKNNQGVAVVEVKSTLLYTLIELLYIMCVTPYVTRVNE